jgi:parvulin-like peptidyl-prolyl isomerase
VSYKGASGSGAARTKEEAKKRAEEVLAKAKAGQDFAALSTQYSDDTGAKARGGALGNFTREQMVAPFSAAAFALRPGQLSGIVETNFGFHIIKRTE